MMIKMPRDAVRQAEMQARRTRVYIMTDEERAAVRRGLAQADRGEFVPDELVAEADSRHDR
jgi:predicted transcriptional regulator